MFRGILFDFDGTLADTMETHCLSWKRALSQYGIDMEPSDYYPLEGMNLHEIAWKLMQSSSWTSAMIDDLVWAKKKYYVEQQKQIRFFPGVEFLIGQLRKNKIPMGIVTAGYLDQLCLSVPEKFLNQFDTLVTGDQVSKSKPAPDPYLKGAKILKLKPGECIAVENAPLGVRSAKAAGVYCMAIASTVNPADLAEADEVLENFSSLATNSIMKRLLGFDIILN